jgi:hypothetical protein
LRTLHRHKRLWLYLFWRIKRAGCDAQGYENQEEHSESGEDIIDEKSESLSSSFFSKIIFD